MSSIFEIDMNFTLILFAFDRWPNETFSVKLIIKRLSDNLENKQTHMGTMI